MSKELECSLPALPTLLLKSLGVAAPMYPSSQLNMNFASNPAQTVPSEVKPKKG